MEVVNHQPALHEFFMSDCWMKLYPTLRRNWSQEKGDGALDFIHSAMDQLWCLICTNEGRVCSPRMAFNYWVSILMQFSEELLGEALFETSKGTREERLAAYFSS